MFQIELVCDFRESFPSKFVDCVEVFNDHPKKDSVLEILDAINEIGYPCNIFGGVPELLKASQNNNRYEDKIFINLSDGLNQSYSRVQVPMLCEILKVKYSGSPPFVAALMNNKHYSKLALNDLNVLIPAGLLINKHTQLKTELFNRLKFPIIVKPNTEGSSLGITLKSVCDTIEEAHLQIENLLAEFEEILIEEYIAGYDVTNLVIGNKDDIKLNEVIVIQTHQGLINYREVFGIYEKANKLSTRLIGEEVFSSEQITKIQLTSEKIAAHIGARDICRIDYRVTNSGDIYFLEINSVPRISTSSEVGFICSKRNISFKDVLQYYIESVLSRF
ncbi:hypothetical protein BBD42_28470 [Paenibacillus sp. BIHB 4019]|uniref:ATP-grasp domain-containing protein n=1 Tax=Paenibacillus sp. BIHB 4019 TaxID=1870819 RepID=A0A1B2DQM0_9BACL|nr:ATP-grasp domain-containing protein [Paenibacillus sp. BIHB 4019]ANY69997.1 hypothetical protein BBD42_28470 [Paenibacillus sp. BIHB 4019]